MKEKTSHKNSKKHNEMAIVVLQERRDASAVIGYYVFPNTLNERKGTRLLMKAFYSAMSRAGIKDFRFHDLRHTFATRLVQNGVDLYTLQRLGRWKTVTMVQRHAHHNPESLRSGIEVMDSIPKPVITNLSHPA